MKAAERKLTLKQEHAIIALLNETTIKAAAERVGVSEVTPPMAQAAGFPGGVSHR